MNVQLLAADKLAYYSPVSVFKNLSSLGATFSSAVNLLQDNDMDPSCLTL